uniref:Cilia- and flagella-associated protein 91 n=2 Tax=Spumella elongata TaxID=89044 RepID=A0A7S3M5Z5_9STRA|mmetsp:Transcript_34648/g.59708  ORF Transcript_34648/g.59708 Transcript_34648/m.59708 type:complete len:594 (+) Transcript_34648:37-1818(+)
MSRNIAHGTSSTTIVSGTDRYKYFKRPIMPRVSAVAPQILLAPTTAEDPLVPTDNRVEASVKDVEVQTAYRESEAQTVPYTPNYIVTGTEAPEVLLLKDLTYENGLPLGKKEVEMIEYARAKRDMESNLPPFTDEASLILRKKLMEKQEMREFKMRETEIDAKREAKLAQIEKALVEREESNEFLTSQRLENVRLLRMEEREKVLQKIRNKRIKALRRLAHQRNISDPVLSDGTNRDIINDYFDKGSRVYAPVRRLGQENAPGPEKFDVASRTLPLDNISNIISLEYTIPRRMLEGDNAGGTPLMAKTAPLRKAPAGGGGRAAEPRLTSAAQRAIRLTKRDVEEMHIILSQKKFNDAQIANNATNSRPFSAGNNNSHNDSSRPTSPKQGQVAPSGKSSILTALLAKKPKGRPPTPDFTSDRILAPAPVKEPEEDEDGIEIHEERPPPVEDNTNYALKNNHAFQASLVLLQRLIRGRAVQNIMFEGKHRRRELIDELKAADEEDALYEEPTSAELLEKQREMEEHQLRETTVDALAGSVASNVLHVLAQEQVRVDMFSQMQKNSEQYIVDRRHLEGAEAGRRQKEGLVYPNSNK